MKQAQICRIISLYRDGMKIDAISKELGVAWEIVRKVLITNGEFRSPLSDKILAMHDSGMTSAEIAAELGMKKRSVWWYLPYSKGMYNGDSPSKNAIALRKIREKRRSNKP